MLAQRLPLRKCVLPGVRIIRVTGARSVDSREFGPIFHGRKNHSLETNMIAGIVLILAGVLLIIYPPLLSIIVAAFLIFAGIMVLSVVHYNRKHQRHYENPTVELFFRY
jgi:UPF0716 family protein affecting phage T7 exclusion